MKAYIVDSDYDLSQDGKKTIVRLFGRLENGKSFLSVNEIEPYFFIKQADSKKLKQYLLKYKTQNTRLTTFAKEPVIKISHSQYGELTRLASYLHERGIETYEADIKPHKRFIMDNDLLGTIEIKGKESETSERIDKIFYEPEISCSSYAPKLKVMSIDIESDKSNDKLLCVGVYSEGYKKVFMITDKKIPNTLSCKNEHMCLQKLKEKILELDPDIITGWNIADFDFPYLKERYEKNKLSFDIGRDNSEIRLRIAKEFFKKSTVTIAGRQVLDALSMIKDPFIKEAPSIKSINIDSWTLESVSQALLKEGKLITGQNRHEEIENLYKTGTEKSLQRLADYNLQDARLAYLLLEKTNTLELAIERSQLTGLQLDRITASIAAFDSLYIRAARKQDLVSPTTKYTHKEERIKGGYVRESNPGIYHGLLVLDFKSLYPSVIKTFNIDPASFIQSPAHHKSGEIIKAPNNAHFLNTKGILPDIIAKLHEAREKAKREKRELASYAIKIIQNSFFGVLASPNCRYFSLDIANAITHFGQYIIKLTAEKIEEKGYKVIYSDTDSIFIDASNAKENPAKIGQDIQDYINNFYKRLVKENYNRESYLELEFKRHYLAFLMPSIRGAEKGSKKRYAGLYKKEGKD